MNPDAERPVIERSPSVPEVPLAATREDFMTAGNSLGYNNQIGSRVFTMAWRLPGRSAEFPSARIDGEPAVSPEVIEAIVKRGGTVGIREKGLAIIDCLYRDIRRRQGLDPNPDDSPSASR